MADQNQYHWVEVKIKCDGELAEALAEVLGRFVSNGVVMESITEYNPHTKENEPVGGMIVSGYLAVNEQLEEKKQKLAEALWHLGQIAPIPEPSYQPIEDQNWMEAWKVHYQPLRIGKNILIMPAWMDPKPDEKRLVIRINPAMAFGTGTHPTTQLCLQLLERHFAGSGEVIDVGCGSGILSIAALQMGAAHVVAVDVDGQSVISTLENAAINHIQPERLEVGKGSVEAIRSGQFSIQKAPLVMVNILATIILRLFEQNLGELVAEDGILLLSGILEHQQTDILTAAQSAGFTLIDCITESDWVSLALKKTEPGASNAAG